VDSVIVRGKLLQEAKEAPPLPMRAIGDGGLVGLRRSWQVLTDAH